MLQRTWLIFWKEIIQIKRDPRLLFVAAFFPLVILVIYGYAINLDVQHLRLAIYDQDRTPDSRDLISVFSNTEYFDLVRIIRSPDEIDKIFDSSFIKVVLVIPCGFSRDLAGSLNVPIQVLIDGTDSTSASTGMGYASGMLAQFSSKILLKTIQRKGIRATESLIPLETRPRYWYNPELKSNIFIIPGLIAVILMMLSTLMTSMTVVREKERGTIESLIVSPIRPVELMIGKLFPYVFLAFIDVVFVILAAIYVFDVPFRGSAALALALSGVFLAAALGIGLLISTLASTQQVAMTMALIGSQLPTVLMSGFIFPIHSMPWPVQWVTTLIPATHFVKIMRGIFLKNSGMSLLLVPTLYLAFIGLLMVGLSIAGFRKKL